MAGCWVFSLVTLLTLTPPFIYPPLGSTSSLRSLLFHSHISKAEPPFWVNRAIWLLHSYTRATEQTQRGCAWKWHNHPNRCY